MFDRSLLLKSFASIGDDEVIATGIIPAEVCDSLGSVIRCSCRLSLGSLVELHANDPLGSENVLD